MATPLIDPQNPALVRDFQAEGRLVYLKDINFDSRGHPVILIITSDHHLAGPKGDPRVWTIVHWTGRQWEFHKVTTASHNYDMGSLYIEVLAYLKWTLPVVFSLSRGSSTFRCILTGLSAIASRALSFSL